MTDPIVFFSRCRPQDSDPIEIVLREKRIFIGWPAWRQGSEYKAGKLRECIIDLSCPDAEWKQLLSQLEEVHRQYTQNRNLVSRVTKGSVALVPRPARGVIFAGRVTGPFELVNDPPWAADYLRIREQQGLPVEDVGSHVADVAQTWQVDEFRPIPYPLIPAWIRRSLFGRSTYGQIYSLDILNLDPYVTLDRLIDHPEQITREWTNRLDEIERRLVTDVGPSTFEHLCVALLQLEHPDENWAHVGGSGDGGVDGIGADANGVVVGLLQCKWRYYGEELSFATPWSSGSNGQRRILASLLHGNDVHAPDGPTFWSRVHIADLVRKHSARLPLAISMRIRS